MARDVQTPQLGGKLPIILFIFILLAFVVESQLTQYVQTTLGYRQPFFLFYVVHSAFSIIFPLHFFYLTTFKKYSSSALWEGLRIAITDHLSPQDEGASSLKFPTLRFFRLSLILSMGINFPGLLWFAAVSLASISDVTAIWNTNAFFAYVITVKLFKLKFQPRRLLAVILATLGVLAVVYGGSTSNKGKPSRRAIQVKSKAMFGAPSAPLVGDLLTLIASIGYGLYQVLYKKYAAISSDPEIVSEHLYDQIPHDDSTIISHNEVSTAELGDSITPPFGLHANLLTSIIGLITFFIVWIPIPILHYYNVEPFISPPNFKVIFAIAGIALSGVIFNAGFMILLGIWGPIITSVGNLLTIVLVFFSDMIFGVGLEILSLWSLLGCSVIVMAFGVLAYDMFSQEP